MQYSTNNRLKLPEGTDNVRRQDFVDNFNIIDNGLTKFYVAILDSTNTYKITTGNSLTALNNGYSIKVAIPSASTGAVSIIVDSVTVAVKKPNGNAVTNFKANGVYNLTYYNSVFILASGSVDDVTFTSDKLLTGYSANDSNGEKVNGTMANKGDISQSLSLNGSITLPSGYYSGINITQSVTTRGAQTDAVSQGINGDYIYTRIPTGAYFTKASTGYPEIKSKITDISSIISSNASDSVKNSIISTLGGSYIEVYTVTNMAKNETLQLKGIPKIIQWENSDYTEYCLPYFGRYQFSDLSGHDRQHFTYRYGNDFITCYTTIKDDKHTITVFY